MFASWLWSVTSFAFGSGRCETPRGSASGEDLGSLGQLVDTLWMPMAGRGRRRKRWCAVTGLQTLLRPCNHILSLGLPHLSRTVPLPTTRGKLTPKGFMTVGIIPITGPALDAGPVPLHRDSPNLWEYCKAQPNPTSSWTCLTARSRLQQM